MVEIFQNSRIPILQITYKMPILTIMLYWLIICTYYLLHVMMYHTIGNLEILYNNNEMFLHVYYLKKTAKAFYHIMQFHCSFVSKHMYTHCKFLSIKVAH